MFSSNICQYGTYIVRYIDIQRLRDFWIYRASWNKLNRLYTDLLDPTTSKASCWELHELLLHWTYVHVYMGLKLCKSTDLGLPSILQRNKNVIEVKKKKKTLEVSLKLKYNNLINFKSYLSDWKSFENLIIYFLTYFLVISLKFSTKS